VMLPGVWQDNSFASAIEPWSATAGSCNSQLPVWCVQD